MIEDLRVDIGKPQNPHIQKVADILMGFGLMDLLIHFHKCWRYRHMKTWTWVIQVRVMRERSE